MRPRDTKRELTASQKIVNYRGYLYNALIFNGILGGERGIRTLEGLLTLTPLAGVRLRPLGHLSVYGPAQGIARRGRRRDPHPASRAAMILASVSGGKTPPPGALRPCGHVCRSVACAGLRERAKIPSRAA